MRRQLIDQLAAVLKNIFAAIGFASPRPRVVPVYVTGRRR
jgi:hypothetical protein